MHVPAIISRSVDRLTATLAHRSHGAGVPAARFTRHGDQGGVVLLVPDYGDLVEDLLPLRMSLTAAGYRVATLGAALATKAGDRLSGLAEAVDALVSLAEGAGPVTAVIGHGTGVTVAMLALGRHQFTTSAVLIAADAHGTEPLAHDLGEVRSLLIHSTDDEIASLHDALDLAEAWPNSILERVERLGHRRILTSSHSANAVLRFLDDGEASRPSLH